MAIPPWENGSPLRLFLHWAYAHAGMRLTHAGTLGIGGAGALIVGASGSGKSGTTLAGLLNGLESAGDDYVLLEGGEDLTAHAVFRIFKQDSNGLRRVGLDPAVWARRRSIGTASTSSMPKPSNPADLSIVSPFVAFSRLNLLALTGRSSNRCQPPTLPWRLPLPRCFSFKATHERVSGSSQS